MVDTGYCRLCFNYSPLPADAEYHAQICREGAFSVTALYIRLADSEEYCCLAEEVRKYYKATLYCFMVVTPGCANTFPAGHFGFSAAVDG